MLHRLLPKQVDNDYRGNLLAVWAFVPICAVTIIRSLIHMFRSDGGAQSIATIPLDSYPPQAANAVVTIFALWGLSQLLLGLLYLVVLIRYRALIPLMYLTLIAEYLGRIGLGTWKPLETLETPPGASMSLIMVVLAATMLALALRAPQSGKRTD